jgi:hypothetical protein
MLFVYTEMGPGTVVDEVIVGHPEYMFEMRIIGHGPDVLFRKSIAGITGLDGLGQGVGTWAARRVWGPLRQYPEGDKRTVSKELTKPARLEPQERSCVLRVRLGVADGGRGAYNETTVSVLSYR